MIASAGLASGSRERHAKPWFVGQSKLLGVLTRAVLIFRERKSTKKYTGFDFEQMLCLGTRAASGVLFGIKKRKTSGSDTDST